MISKRQIFELFYSGAPFVHVVAVCAQCEVPDWLRTDVHVVLLVGDGCARPPNVNYTAEGLIVTELTSGSHTFEAKIPWIAVMSIQASDSSGRIVGGVAWTESEPAPAPAPRGLKSVK